MKLKRFIIAFLLIMTLVCASVVDAVPADQNQAGAVGNQVYDYNSDVSDGNNINNSANDSHVETNSEDVGDKSYIVWIGEFIKTLENSNETEDQKKLIEDLKKLAKNYLDDTDDSPVVSGSENNSVPEITENETVTSDPSETIEEVIPDVVTSDDSVAPAVDVTVNSEDKDDDNDSGSSAGLVVVIVLLAVILVAVGAVAFVPGLKETVIGLFDPKHGKNKSRRKTHRSDIPDKGKSEPQSYSQLTDGNGNRHVQSDADAGQSQRNQFDISDIYGDPVNNVQNPAGQSVQRQEERPSVPPPPPPPNFMQLAIEEVMNSYRSANVDASGWKWYELDKDSLRDNAKYLTQVDNGYTALVYRPTVGSRNFHQYVLFYGQYLFPNLYTNYNMDIMGKNSMFMTVAFDTEMYHVFKFVDGNNNPITLDKNYTRFEIVKIEPAIAKVDQDSGNLSVTKPGTIVIRYN